MKKAAIVKIITGIIVKALPCCWSNCSLGLRISELGETAVSSGTRRHCARSFCHQPHSPELEVTRSRLQAHVDVMSCFAFCKRFQLAYVCSNMLAVVLCQHSVVLALQPHQNACYCLFFVELSVPLKLTNQRPLCNTCKQQWRPVEHVDWKQWKAEFANDIPANLLIDGVN